MDPFVLWHQQYRLVYRRKSVNPITHQPKYNCLKATAARGILVRFFFIFFFFLMRMALFRTLLLPQFCYVTFLPHFGHLCLYSAVALRKRSTQAPQR